DWWRRSACRSGMYGAFDSCESISCTYKRCSTLGACLTAGGAGQALQEFFFQLADALVAAFLLFSQSLVDNHFQAYRHGQLRGHGRGRIFDVLGKYDVSARSAKWRVAGETLIHDAAQGVNVRSFVRLLAFALLGAHVERAAEDVAGACDFRFRILIGNR